MKGKIDSLRTWLLIHACARQGSLAQAALSLSMDLADASRRLSALERELGFSLLDRAKRPARPTENLLRVDRYASCISKACRDIDLLAAKIRAEREAPRMRTVRISLPINMDKAGLLAAFHAYQEIHRMVRIELSADSGIPSLIAGKTDISMGGYLLEKPELFWLPVEDCYNFLMATPKYIERHGEPHRVEDLLLPQHRVLLRNHGNLFFSNKLENGEQSFYLGANANVFYGDAAACRDMMLSGDGIAMDLNVGYVAEYLAAGSIVPVLPGWHRTPFRFHVYCRRSESEDALIRELMSLVQKVAFRSISNQWRFWYRHLGLPAIAPTEQS